MMQRCILMAYAAACIFGVSTAAFAQPLDASQQAVALANPEITAMLATFPAGGPGLRAAIARAVEDDAALINDVIIAANEANSYQWQAIRLGLVDAANFFATVGSNSALDAEWRIQAALRCLNVDIGSAAGTSLGPEVMQGVPGFTIYGGATAGCISRSRPGC
jgi:hypothetical protein